MSQFNLIDEAWIPVRKLDGERVELGIRDTLLAAKDIAAIEDGSPLVVAALHRFLLAVLYRALEGPTDIDQARAWFKTGLPARSISTYLEQWRDRFWLFDETHPFGQNPNVPAKEIEPWTKLTAEHNATTNKVLFDHVDTKAPGARSFAECARWLVSTMNFSLSGGRGYFPSPSVNGLMCIPVGPALHETLCYCLVDQNRVLMKDDVPLWERDPEKLPITSPKRAPRGNADLYSWPARMVLLEKEESAVDKVTNIRFIAGLGYDSDTPLTDPMQAYDPRKVKEDKKRRAVPFCEGRGTWRDFDSLLPGAGGEAPLTVQHSVKLANRDAQCFPKSILVLGLRYTLPNANVDFWRMERFALPEALLSERSIRSDIRQLLADAEDNQQALWRACRSFGRDLLSRGEREPDSKDISRFVEQMPTITTYWSTLEVAFHEVLRGYVDESDPDDIRLAWLITVRSTLHDSWQKYAVSVSTGNAWSIRALVRAEAIINKQLRVLKNEILQYETYRQSQEEAV